MPAWAQRVRPAELRELGLSREDIRAMGLKPRELRALGLRPWGQELINLSAWPAEPTAPKNVDTTRLANALRQLCPPLLPSKASARYAEWIVKHSARFGVDPMLVAGLIYQQSRCLARKRSSWGLGLAMINVPMHRGRIKDGRYRHWIFDGGQWSRRQLVMDRYPFNPKSLLRPEVNIYFTAGILAVLAQQCPAMDSGFRSVPHRHPVSHFVWGDQVRSAGVEDRVLRARRRLIAYYGGQRLPALGRFKDLPLVCPLDGPPRKITSGLGDDREGGKRRHTGIDFDSSRGEPVRAIADGTVILAGVDIGRQRLRPLDPKLTRLVPAIHMGPRGLLVTIEHAHGLVSSYMHLMAYVVRTGDKVKAGQLIGYVGRSGIKESDAHLHFGLQHNGGPIDPIPLLGPYVFPPSATYVGRSYLALQRKRRRARRRAQRRGQRRPWVGGTSLPRPKGKKRRRFDPSRRAY